MPTSAAVLGGVLAEVVDDLLDRAEGDAVAQSLLGAVDDDAVALVVGGVGAPMLLLGDGCGPEVSVVHDGVVVAGHRQRPGHVRLPHALGQPGATRSPAHQRLDLVSHLGQLPHAVVFAQRGQHRFVVAAAQDLHLAALDQGAQTVDHLRALRP